MYGEQSGNKHADIRVLKVNNKTLGLASREKVTIITSFPRDQLTSH